jgi:hypothetical protein
MRKTPKAISNKGSFSDSFFAKLVSVIKVIRIELLITLVALILSLGQYFQNSINVRINITSTWRQGYTSETRTRVNRFIHFWKNWKAEECPKTEGANCEKVAKDAIDIFASNDKLYGGEVRKNPFIKFFLQNEVNASIREENSRRASPNTNSVPNQASTQSTSDREATEAMEEAYTEDAYIKIILNYKNAIIECLNTIEAVKAVIQSKPLPFKVTIFYKDTLEGRYQDIIEELKEGLMDFIVAYREQHLNRETEAWYVLTSDESNLNDFVNVVLYFLVFSAVLISVYLVKIQMLKRGYLQEF